MSSEEISIFEPELEIGPKKFIILTEHDSIEDYEWIVDEFDPDLTYIIYPSTLFSSYFRNYQQLLKAHAPDNIGFNSALYALTNNQYGFGFYNTLWRRCYAYLTETESVLNACDNHQLYFNLSTQLLSDQNKKNKKNHNIVVGPELNISNIDKNGLFIRGVRDYCIKILLFDDQTDVYDAHFTEHAKIDGEAVPKHLYFLSLWNSYANTENEHDFWQYLIKWRDMIYWDYVIDSNAYLPAPRFTKILRKSYQLYPPNHPLRHLPLNTSFRSLVHDTFNNLQQLKHEKKEIDKVVLIVPTNAYSEHFIELYGNTKNDDLIHASPYREFDDFMHPRIKPLAYSAMGIGFGYYFKTKQHKFKDIVWKRRMYRMGRWTANGVTAGFLGVYWLGTCYFNLISSHSYCRQTMAKQIDNLKNDTPSSGKNKRKWTDYIFRRVHRI